MKPHLELAYGGVSLLSGHRAEYLVDDEALGGAERLEARVGFEVVSEDDGVGARVIAHQAARGGGGGGEGGGEGEGEGEGGTMQDDFDLVRLVLPLSGQG